MIYHQFRYIIQTWVESSASLPQKLLDLGYELIMSTKNAWYVIVFHFHFLLPVYRSVWCYILLSIIDTISFYNRRYFDHGFWGTTKFYTWKMAYDNRLPFHKGKIEKENVFLF